MRNKIFTISKYSTKNLLITKGKLGKEAWKTTRLQNRQAWKTALNQVIKTNITSKATNQNCMPCEKCNEKSTALLLGYSWPKIHNLNLMKRKCQKKTKVRDFFLWSPMWGLNLRP